MATPTWDEWVKHYNADNAPAAPAPGGGASTGSLSAANLGNINSLFNPEFGRTETLTHAAEDAVGGGWGGGGFAANHGLKLLDSEKKANWELGNKMLEPYLAREHEDTLNAANNNARLQQIAAEGAAALQRLQLSEAGQTARLNTSESAALQRAVLEGQQAMQRLRVTEAGATGRQRESIGGGIASDLIRASIAGGGGGGGGGSSSPVRSGPGGRVNLELGATYNPAVPQYGSTVGMKPYGSGTPAYNPNAHSVTIGGVGALGSTSIDRILARYGLLG